MVSIVIPSHDNLASVKVLLASIYKYFRLGAVNREIILVDDASRLCDMRELNKEYPEIKVLRLESNAGAAGARNAGANLASHDIILFLDSDIELCCDAVAMVEKIMQDQEVDAVVGTFSEISLRKGLFPEYWAMLKAYFHSLPVGSSSSFYPAIGAIRKRVFLDVGGFDSNIKGASVEDYEFSGRLFEKGYEVRFDPEIIVKMEYKFFLKSLSQSIDRAKKWSIMFLDKKKFDNHTTTLWQGVANVLGFLTWVFLLLSLFKVYFLYIAAAIFLSFVYLSRKFFWYILKRRGPFFLLISIYFYLVSSFFITFSSLKGMSYIFRSREKRREALYG